MLARPAAALAVLLLAGAGAVCAHEFSAKGVSVVHPWARATPGGATIGAAYLEIRPPRGRPTGSWARDHRLRAGPRSTPTSSRAT